MELKSTKLDQRMVSPNKVFAATPITEFYSGKSVFITGSTGFLGTLLLGKLLTTCPIKRAFVLMKPKKGKSVSERFAELLQSMVFDEVRKNNINALDNVVPILGDITQPNLGMSDEFAALLSQEVHVVFHSAANINMGAKLTDAINVNTKGTAELVKVCKRMRQLQAFVYVSTAYSNCNRNLIDERIYEPGTSLDAVYEIYEKMDTVENARYKHNLIEGRPNTYTYSKSLAEKIIDDEILGIPAAIVRPSIIVSPVKTPLPGWANSWNSVNKVAAAISQGFLRCYYGSYDSPLDIVPGDQVANLLIATAWDAHSRRRLYLYCRPTYISTPNFKAKPLTVEEFPLAETILAGPPKFPDQIIVLPLELHKVYQTSRQSEHWKLKKVKVYNCCASYQNPMSTGHFLSSCARISRKYSEKIVCTNMMVLTTKRWLHTLMNILFHIIPSYVLDTLSWLRGQQGRMKQICSSLVRECGVCEYFGFHDVTFIDYNVRQLLRGMHPEDKILFDFDFSAIDWENYLHIYIRGIKKYIVRK